MTGTRVKRRARYLVTVLWLAVIVANGVFVGTAAAGPPDCGSVTYTGSGNDSDPWQVSNVDQLQCITENLDHACDH